MGLYSEKEFCFFFFLSDIQGDIPNDAFQMQRLSSRSGPGEGTTPEFS